MSPTLTVTPVRRAIYGKLAGDTTLNALLGTPSSGHSKAIYYQLAPDGAAFPYVVFQKQAGTPTYAMVRGTSAFDEDVWMVKGVDHSKSADAVEAVAQRLDVLLTDATLSISGATLLYLRRESTIDYSELDSGEVYRHSGALFRVIYE